MMEIIEGTNEILEREIPGYGPSPGLQAAADVT